MVKTPTLDEALRDLVVRASKTVGRKKKDGSG